MISRRRGRRILLVRGIKQLMKIRRCLTIVVAVSLGGAVPVVRRRRIDRSLRHVVQTKIERVILSISQHRRDAFASLTIN